MWGKKTVVVHTTVGSLLFSSVEHKHASHNSVHPKYLPLPPRVLTGNKALPSDGDQRFASPSPNLGQQ